MEQMLTTFISLHLQLSRHHYPKPQSLTLFQAPNFTTETGEHFSQYLTRIRIEKSKELLSEFPSYNISTIAEKVGCGNNPQYFSQIFKKYCGVTPKNYVKSLQKDNINIMDSF